MKFSIDGFRELFSKDNVGGVIVKYKRQIAVGCILLCLGVAAIVNFTGKDKEENVETKADVAKDEDTGSKEAAEAEKQEGGAVGTTMVNPGDLLKESNPLEKDAHPEVNALIQQYYDSMAAGDMDSLTGLVDQISEEEIKKILTSRDVVEGYQNISCYTKKGMEDGSYMVFVYYELKFAQIETPAPGLEFQYVYTNEEGSLVLFNQEDGEELNASVESVIEGEDVQTLRAEVKEKYEAAKASDEDLVRREERYAKAGEETPEEEAPSEEPAENPEEQPEEPPAEEQPEEEPEEEPETGGEATAQNRETRFTESVRLRAQPSTEAENLGTAYQGEHVTQIESYGDGWSKINYNGKECYCMTEFLE